MELRLRRVGNSLGVILPKEALAALGVESKAGEKLSLAKLADGRGFELRHLDAKFEKKLALLRDTIKRYKNTLRALARQFGKGGIEALETRQVFNAPEVASAGGLRALQQIGAGDILRETKEKLLAP